MAEEALLAALDEDARTQADSIIQDAEAEAAALIKSASEDAASALEAMLAQAARTVERSRAEILNSARVKASASLIECRRALIEDVFERSTDAFSSIERIEYGLVLNLWYAELFAAWDKLEMPGEPIVAANPADVEVIAASGAPLKVDPTVKLGLVFISADGRVRLENTFLARMNKAKEDLVPLVDRILFPDCGHLNGCTKES